MKKIIIITTIMAVIMAASAVALDSSATKKYNAAQAATASYPHGYSGIASLYARDISEFAWTNYMDAVNWLDKEYKNFNGEIKVTWEPNKMVYTPNHPAEVGFDILVELANGKSVRTAIPAKDVYK